MKKKHIIYILLIILLGGLLFIFKDSIFKNPSFIKLNYEEVQEKVNNNDTFILCISRTECSHCQSYKPKLNKIAKEYNVTIYYTEIDKYTDEEYKTFKTNFSFDGGTPTTIFFKDGIEKTTASRIEGDVSLEKIINKLKQNGFINE